MLHLNKKGLLVIRWNARDPSDGSSFGTEAIPNYFNFKYFRLWSPLLRVASYCPPGRVFLSGGEMGRFAQDRHKPEGDWVQTTMVESVVGVQHRKASARAFARAARKAEVNGLIYGIQLEHQPNNRYDSNAIAVYGVAEWKGWFRRSIKEWHIGFLDRDVAHELVQDLVSKRIPIAAELYSIYEGQEGYLDFKIIVLAPPGNSLKARTRPDR